MGDDAADSVDQGTGSGDEADRREDSGTVCAVLHCARTGATPDGRPLAVQGQTFCALLEAAHTAISVQARMNTNVFLELTKAMGAML